MDDQNIEDKFPFVLFMPIVDPEEKDYELRYQSLIRSIIDLQKKRKRNWVKKNQ